MSISDRIVVMRDGRVQQIGAPQTIYDDPANLFVAQFLGTPPINVFHGTLQGRRLLMGGVPVLATDTDETRQITVAIRPEGFIVDPSVPFSCSLQAVEVMGRDVSCVCTHPAMVNESGRMRAIIDAGTRPDAGVSDVHFRLKPEKVLLFDPDTGERLYAELSTLR